MPTIEQDARQLAADFSAGRLDLAEFQHQVAYLGSEPVPLRPSEAAKDRLERRARERHQAGEITEQEMIEDLSLTGRWHRSRDGSLSWG